jgi:hypothetical protein
VPGYCGRHTPGSQADAAFCAGRPWNSLCRRVFFIDGQPKLRVERPGPGDGIRLKSAFGAEI